MKKNVIRLFVIIFSCFCVFPMVIAIFNSFMSYSELAYGFHIIPRDFTIFQYEQVLLRMPQYLMWFWNSVNISFFIIALSIPISLMAAYGFAKFSFPFRDFLFFTYIIVMLMPFQVTLVPQYIVLNKLGFLNTSLALILPNIFSAFGVFLMVQFMKSIDDEIVDAAKIDGLAAFQIFLRIIVPLSKPAISALFILLFIESWSMIEQPMIFLNDTSLIPLSLYLGSVSSTLYAGGVIFLILPLLAYLFGYESLVKGISLGSLK